MGDVLDKVLRISDTCIVMYMSMSLLFTSIQPYRYNPIMNKNNHKLVYDVGFVIYCVLLSRC